MANSLSASFPKYWSKRMQRKHDKTDVFRAIANFEEQANLKNGDTVARPYRSAIVAQTYSRGTSVTFQSLTDTEETLVVQTSIIAPFQVDDLDALQSNYKTMNLYADDAAVIIGNWIDGDVLGEAANATSKVGAFEIAGTGSAGDGLGFTLTTSNVLSMFAKVARKLDEQKIAMDSRFMVISPAVKEVLVSYLAGKASNLGDSTGLNGHIGSFYGFELYLSNSNLWTGSLAYDATTPSNGDTVVINGVTFTFVTSIGTTAGNVLAETDGVTSFTNLMNAINAPATTSAKQVALTAANQAKLKHVVASGVSGATGAMVITAKGAGYFVVSETLTPAADVWTTTKQVQHILAGKKGCIDVVIQKNPTVEVKEIPDQLGKNIMPYTLYGWKTFIEGAQQMVDVLVRTDAY